MITEYINAAMSKAKYEILEDNKSYYGEIPGFEGLYANESTLEECRTELKNTLEDWILISLAKNLPLPVIDGTELKIPEKVNA